MKDIFNILAGDVAAEIKNRIQASAKDVAMLLAATLLLVCGFVVLMFAGYVFLLRFMEPAYAALIIAGLFVLAALVLLMAIRQGAAHPEKSKEPAKEVQPGQPDMAVLEAQAKDYIRRHGKTATFMSLIAGVVVGSSPEVRRTLTHALDVALAEHQARRQRREEPPDRDRR